MAYNAADITVLEGLEAVRKRPAMYIGGTGKGGYHHLLWEIIDNSVDEALNGHASRVDVTVDVENSLAVVSDNGRGIPFGPHPKYKKPAVEVILTTLHSGGKFDGAAYKTAGGLHGVGSSVVNVLSSDFQVDISREKKRYSQKYSRGVPRPPAQKTVSRSSHGTTISFTPDPQIFGKKLRFDLELIRSRVEAKAYLTPGVLFLLNGEEFQFEGGLVDLLGAQLEAESLVPVTEFPFTMTSDDLHVALTWTTDPRQSDHLVKSFANGIPTQGGGTHAGGLKSAVAEAVREYLKKKDLVPKRMKLEASDVREGLCGALHVLVAEPQFKGQTKDELNNPEVRGMVRKRVRAALLAWMDANKMQTSQLALRVIDAVKARTASRDARDRINRQSAVRRLALPGKLADCSSRDLEETELFIVEGDSAGGSAKQGRDRSFQAVLPLSGKIINALSNTEKKVLAHPGIKDLVLALGCGTGPFYTASRLRYGKIIMLMDADVDGLHISTLMMTFFWKYMPELIEDGRLYLAEPPLYKAVYGTESFWAADDSELEDYKLTIPARSRDKIQVSYFKGLGEMNPGALFETTMDPDNRRVRQVVIPDGQELATAILLNDLMGKDATRRLPYITEFSREGGHTLDPEARGAP